MQVIIGGTGNNDVITVGQKVARIFSSRHKIDFKSRKYMGSVNIDTGTYHPASASKKSSSSSSSSLVSSNGRLMLALDEDGLSYPRSFASTSVAHTALLRPQLNQERQEEEFRCLSNVECLDILSTDSFVFSSSAPTTATGLPQ
eukprot:scaffold33125_cov43-Attheya_sp.AAC.3